MSNSASGTDGDAPDAAIRTIRSGVSKYPTFLLDVIDGMNLGSQSMDIANVTIDELFPGMILADSIETQEGEPVVTSGTWVTATLVHQLRCIDGQQPLAAPFRVISPPDVLRTDSSSYWGRGNASTEARGRASLYRAHSDAAERRLARQIRARRPDADRFG